MSHTAVLADSTERWRSSTSRAIHSSAQCGSESLLGAIASGLASVAVPWELANGESATERQYELLITTEVYDAWLIHWPVGTGLDHHDHGESAGAFAVVAGTLDEGVVDGGTTVTTRVDAGESVVFGGGHVHAVVNRGEVAATSVHVYSPPLASMGYYRQDIDGRLVAERFEAAGSWSVTPTR
ncbi:MAG: cysteine dioxygenase family protein [Acidimicrobiia bacterium]